MQFKIEAYWYDIDREALSYLSYAAYSGDETIHLLSQVS